MSPAPSGGNDFVRTNTGPWTHGHRRSRIYWLSWRLVGSLPAAGRPSTLTPDEELLRSRLRKMVIKNIGMMYYGLPVSRDPRSVLYGNVLGLDDLDYMSEFFEPRP